jgi:GNAT superfamily N-acetyltransferase
MSNPLNVIGEMVWCHLQDEARRVPHGPCQPARVTPWTGEESWRAQARQLPDWAYIASYCGTPASGRPSTMAIGLCEGNPLGYLEVDAATPSAHAAGIAALQMAGATQVITVCRPEPAGLLHVRSLLSVIWWDQAAAKAEIPVTHTFLGPGTQEPMPFTVPAAGKPPEIPFRDALSVELAPTLGPEQMRVARLLNYDPGAPLSYVALLEDWPVGVANVQVGQLGRYGADAEARWSTGSSERVCVIRWISSALTGWGIGTALYARIEADAVKAGARTIVLEAAPFSTVDRFWERQGFRMVRRHPTTPFRYMEKGLAQGSNYAR